MTDDLLDAVTSTVFGPVRSVERSVLRLLRTPTQCRCFERGAVDAVVNGCPVHDEEPLLTEARASGRAQAATALNGDALLGAFVSSLEHPAQTPRTPSD